MTTKKAPPRRNTDVIRCENCGEEYSITYKRCPFCDERPGRSHLPSSGRRMSSHGSGGPSPIQVGGLIVSLILIITAGVIVFRSLSPLLFHSQPSTSQSSQGQSSSGTPAEVQLESLSLSRTELSLTKPGEIFQLEATTDPADAKVPLQWSSSNEAVATVDEYGNVTNVYKGVGEVSIVITVSGGGQTAESIVTCTGDGTGETVQPPVPPVDNGTNEPITPPSTGGSTNTPPATGGGTFAPNTPAKIVGATGGLNIRSGPGTTYEAKATATEGAEVTVLEDGGNGWYKIKYATGKGGYDEGYVMGTYLAPR